jgi:hypothetical protein
MTTRAIRRLPCPASDPPFDDEIGIRPGAKSASHTQGALALAFMLPTGVPAEPELPATLRLVGRSGPGVAARPAGTRFPNLGVGRLGSRRRSWRSCTVSAPSSSC